MNQKVGVVTYVHGWYHDYVPLFARAWQLAYPEYQIMIFCDTIREPIDGVTMIPFPSKHASEKPYYMRWLIPHQYLEHLDRAFICDVDLIPLWEDPTLEEVRDEHMSEIGFPFSNWLRPVEPNYPDRVTGWHWIDVQPYYQKVSPVIDKILFDYKFDIANPPSYSYPNSFGENQWGQEALLFRILNEAFGLGDQHRARNKWLFANHHGLHLGPLRGGMPRDTIMNRLGPNAKFWKTTHAGVRLVMQDAEFRKRCSHTMEPRVRHVLSNLAGLFPEAAGLLDPSMCPAGHS